MMRDGRARTSTMLAMGATVVVVLTGFALTMVAAAPEDTTIAVVWDVDGMGFSVTSSKDLSNVIVLLCDGTAHKHEAEFDRPKIKTWSHRESQDIVAIWVKSGNNHDPNGPAPPAPYNNNGAGQYFANPFDECSPVVTTTPPTTTEPPTTTTEPPTSTTPTTTTPPTTTEPPTTTPPTTTPPTTTEPPTTTPPSTTEPPTTTPATSTPPTTTEPPQTTRPTTSPPPTTEIPVFPSTGALALGLLGALGSAFVVLRRRP